MKYILLFDPQKNKDEAFFTIGEIKDEKFLSEKYSYNLGDDIMYPVGTIIEFSSVDFKVEMLRRDVVYNLIKMVVSIYRVDIKASEFVDYIKKEWQVYG